MKVLFAALCELIHFTDHEVPEEWLDVNEYVLYFYLSSTV